MRYLIIHIAQYLLKTLKNVNLMFHDTQLKL